MCCIPTQPSSSGKRDIMPHSKDILRPCLLIVDDESINLTAMKQILEDEYDLLFSTKGQETIALAEKHQPDLILLDVVMGDSNGFDICKSLKNNPKTEHIPVIFVTVLSDTHNEEAGFNAGAVDYISKPVKKPIVKARVRTHLSLVRAKELKASQLQIIRRLARAAELKDDDMSQHISRMSYYAQMLALAYGCSKDWAEDLLTAAPLHDVGKIGIPDTILKKPGKLTDDEWKVMVKHPAIGASIIGNHNSPTLKMAKRLALEHHEKWDGSGYPKGLKGDTISLEARIVAICDVFDALNSKRCYKDAWTLDDALNYVKEQAGKHFDPELAHLFVANKAQIVEIRERWSKN